jgi:hypothetical protein
MIRIENQDETNNSDITQLNNNNYENNNISTPSIETNEKNALMMSEQEQINLVDTLNKLTQYEYDNGNSLDETPLKIMENPVQIDFDDNNKISDQNESLVYAKLSTPIIENATARLISSHVFENTNLIRSHEIIKDDYSCNIVDSSTKTPPTPKNIELIVEETLQDIVNDVSESIDFENINDKMEQKSNRTKNAQVEIDLNIESKVTSFSFIFAFLSD